VATDFFKLDQHSERGMSAVPSKASSLLWFFFFAYALMWACFIAVAAVPIPADSFLGTFLVLLGAFAPSIAAVGLTARAEGKAGVRALLGRAFIWRVGVRWYLFALFYTVAVKLLVSLIYRGLTGAWPRFGTLPLYLIPLAIAYSTPFQAGEEVGWRGYALPRLASRFGLARASLLLGFIWGCWHLPQFFIRGGDTYHQSFPFFVTEVTALSVAMVWLYARTNGSLLLTMLLHAAVNNSKDIIPSALPGATHVFSLNASLVAWLTAAVLWICAGYFLVKMPKRLDFYSGSH